MRAASTHSILERALNFNEQPVFSASQIAIDGALGRFQAFSGDWKNLAISLIVPALASRVRGMFNPAFAARAFISEATLASEVSSAPAWEGLSLWLGRLPKFAKLGSAVLSSGLLGAACTTQFPERTEDAGLSPPRSLEVSGEEYGITPSPSTGTNQGFSASLNANNELAVAWADLNPSDLSHSGIFLRTFSSAGNAGNVVTVDHPQDAIAIAPSLASNSHGNSLVSWTTTAGPEAPSALFARRFSNTGEAQGASFPLVPAALRSLIVQGALAMQEDGSFTAVSNENSTTCAVCARNFSPANIEQSLVALSDPYSPVLASHLASTSQGDWAWAGLLPGENGEIRVRFRYFNVGQGLGPATTFSIGNPQTPSKVQVAVLPNDNSLVVWETNQGLRGMVVAADGRPLSAQLELNSLLPGSAFSVAGDEVGAFVVAWQEAGQIHASLLSSRGQSIASHLNISGEGADNREVQVVGNESGRITFVWRRFHSQGNASYDLVARNFRVQY